MSRGMSMADLLVGVALTVLLLGFLYQTFLSQHRSYTVQRATSELQEGLRTALNLICRELRTAGYNPTGLAEAGLEVCGEARVRFTADRNGDGDIDNSDQERITYWLDGDNLSLQRTLYEGTGSSSTQGLLQGVEALGFAYAYDADGDEALDGPWAVDTDGDGDLDLNLDTNGDGLINEADDTNGDGTIEGQALPSAVALNRVRAVRVWMVARSERKDIRWHDQRTYVVGRQVITPSGDDVHYHRRLLVATVRLRNMGLR